MTEKPFRVLSWGCGAPSTTAGVLSALGHLEKLDAIVTSDTGWERRLTYEARDFYKGWFEDHGIPVEIVQWGDVRELAGTSNYGVPFWTKDGSLLQRRCTDNLKIRPMRRRVRESLRPTGLLLQGL